MILTCLFKHLVSNIEHHPFDDRYTLHPRPTSSIKGKQPRKPPPKKPRNLGKSKHAKFPSTSSSKSSPSDKGDLPSTKVSPRSYCRELLVHENMSQDQRKTKGMFKNLARELHKMGKVLNKGCRIEEHHNERIPSPPPRNKSLSPPQAHSKSTSSGSTSYNTSSSQTISPSPTQVASPPKLRVIIPMKLEPQELLTQQTPPHNPHVLNMDNWPPGSLHPSPPPRFKHPPPGFEHLLPPQTLFVNINNNAPQQEHLPNLPPNLGNQQLPNPHNNILDFVNPNDLPHHHNMFCQSCNTTRHEIHMLMEHVNYMFSYIRHHLGSSCNPLYFPQKNTSLFSHHPRLYGKT
ncbi:hypothetical protein Tco_0554740 [Tanacetum coccineum]